MRRHKWPTPALGFAALTSTVSVDQIPHYSLTRGKDFKLIRMNMPVGAERVGMAPPIVRLYIAPRVIDDPGLDKITVNGKVLEAQAEGQPFTIDAHAVLKTRLPRLKKIPHWEAEFR